MKHLILILVLVGLMGCDLNQHMKGQARNGFNESVQEVCYKGVTYIIAANGKLGFMSVKFNTDSTVETCN